MQVDKGIRGSSWDVADLFHSDLFSANNNTANNNNNLPSSSSSAMSNASSPSSREATPLPTPPSISLGEHFPDPHASSSSSTFQSPDALYGFYDSSPRASTSTDARELLAATGPKFPSSGFTMGGAPNPFNGFPSIDEGDFAAYMHALTGHSSPSQSSQGAHSASQQGSQPQPGMEMMYGFNGMDLEMMNLPMSLDGSFALPGSANPFTGIPMMGMPIDPMGMSMNIGIDPQLVDSPAPLVTMDDEDSPSNSSPQEEEEEAEEAGMDADDDDDEIEAPAPTKRGRKKKADTSLPTVNTRRSTRKSSGESPTSPTSSSSDQEKLTLTIAPVKVGGRGTALGRRGTVLSGGVSKRGTAPAASSVATSALGSTIATPLSERSNTPAPAAPAKRGRKPGPKKALDSIEEIPAPVIAQQQQQPVTSTSSLPVLPASLPPTAPTHTRTASTSKSSTTKGAVGPGGVPHSSSGLGIVPPPLPNGQKHLTPVDLGLGKTFAFAIPMGTFNGGVGGVVPAPGAPGAPPSSSSSSLPTSHSLPAASNAGQNTSPLQAAMSEFGGDDDDEGGAGAGGGAYPADWRPSPEVFAKMSSKEKRQLRNKISARNFRVRRKEYISTLEGDIAERDRLLEAIRNELGSSRNENVALRREVENLKRVLLNGRGVDAQGDSLDNLPPPAPLPEKSAAEMLAAQAAAASASSSPSALFRPNTQKDLATSPRNGQNSFWGGSMNGVLGGGGVTAVHTTFVPAPVVVGLGNGGSPNLGVFSPAWTAPSPFAPALQENMNPLMRSENMNPRIQAQEEAQRKEREVKKVGGGVGEQQKENSFEGFADSNMFTMKNMDTYRMHLWGKMAAQYHAHHHQQQQQQQQQARAPSTSPSLPHIQTPYLTSPYASPQSQSPSPQSQGDATANIYHPNLFQLQQLAQQQQQMVQNSQLQGLAARMGRSWFNAPNNGSANGQGQGENRERVPLGTTTNLVALLSGKGSVLGGSSYSSSTYRRSTGKGDENKPVESAKGMEVAKMDAAAAKKQAEQAQAAMLAVVASQTILKKLGQAFWDAFSGSTASSANSATSAGGVARRFEAPRSSAGGQGQGQASGEKRDWDADKVRKVLDGTAVLRIVDVDQLHKLDGPVASSTTTSSTASKSTIPVVKVSPPLKSNSMPSSIPTLKSSTTSTSAAPTIKQESDGCSTMGACWAQCAGEWCSTETLRNVSKGGSVSVPASPALRPATVVTVPHPSVGLKGGLVGKEQERKMAVLLEEGMKGLRL